MSEKFELSRRKMLAGLGTIGVAGAGAGMGTSALYNDTETSEDNVIQAGTTNLIVEAAVVDVETSNEASGPNDDGLYVNIQDNTADGEPAVGLTVSDMKPGDSFTLRTTVDVEANPMYVAVAADDTADSENTPNPEPEQSTQAAGTNPDTGGDALPGEGDLDNQLDVTYGYDSDRGDLHDNTIEGSLTADPNGTGSATDFIASLQSGILYRGRQGADPGSGDPGGHAGSSALPTRIGGDDSDSNVDREKVTHFTEFSLPIGVGNEVQGDSFSWDLVWTAEQVRNNPDPANSSEVDGNAN